MNKKVIIAAIVVILIIGIVVISSNKGKEDESKKIDLSNTTYVSTKDGEKVNTSEALLKEKMVNGLKFTNIQITTNQSGKTTILADVTIQYMIGTEGELKNVTGGVISEPILKLGDTVFIIVSKDGKQKDGGSVLVIDETIDGTSTTSNTHVYSNLTAGTYTLKVEVVDKAGNKASPEIDGTIEQTTGAGLYDSNGTMLASWSTLVNDYNLNVEKDYDVLSYKENNTDGNSMYYVLKQNFNGKTGLTLIMPGSDQQTANVDNKLDIVNSYEVASINENLKVAATDNQISKIGILVFYGCKSLTSVTIGSGVRSIGERAFSYCYDLSITIPYTVEEIYDKNVFDNCSNVYYENGEDYYFSGS